ncbi:hypothetical protein JZU46_06915 [bacterium]|nr:hypothetical protein [bacterium]
MFLLGEKYRLDLRWSYVEYKDNICFLHGAYFSGPALSFAEKIEPNNNIDLDFFKQYFVLVTNVYIGKLSWQDVIYKEDKVYLTNCTITHKSELNKVPTLKDNDLLVIDCKEHERETHNWFPSYKTYVSNEDTQIYNFAS